MDVNFIEGNRLEERDNIRPFSGIADGHYTIRTSIRMKCNLTNSTVNYISLVQFTCWAVNNSLKIAFEINYFINSWRKKDKYFPFCTYFYIIYTHARACVWVYVLREERNIWWHDILYGPNNRPFCLVILLRLGNSDNSTYFTRTQSEQIIILTIVTDVLRLHIRRNRV